MRKTKIAAFKYRMSTISEDYCSMLLTYRKIKKEMALFHSVLKRNHFSLKKIKNTYCLRTMSEIVMIDGMIKDIEKILKMKGSK